MRDEPIRLLKEAENVAVKTPIAIAGGKMLMGIMYMKLLIRSSREQAAAVKKDTLKYEMSVNNTAVIVPHGMLLPGSFSSPIKTNHFNNIFCQ